MAYDPFIESSVEQKITGLPEQILAEQCDGVEPGMASFSFTVKQNLGPQMFDLPPKLRGC